MKIIQSILILCALSSLISCNRDNNSNLTQENISPSKLTMRSYLIDIKGNDREFDEVLESYFFKYKDILNSEVYSYIYNAIHDLLKETIRDSTLKIQFYWNHEIDSIKRYDWVNDNEICQESLLIIIKDINSDPVNYFTYCFANNGKIYSGISLLDPSDNTIKWLRNQEKYISYDSESGKTSIEIGHE